MRNAVLSVRPQPSPKLSARRSIPPYPKRSNWAPPSLGGVNWLASNGAQGWSSSNFLTAK